MYIYGLFCTYVYFYSKNTKLWIYVGNYHQFDWNENLEMTDFFIRDSDDNISLVSILKTYVKFIYVSISMTIT